MAKSKKARRLDELAAQIRDCTRCPLHESRTHAVPGDGSYATRVMIIGEAPGREALALFTTTLRPLRLSPRI